jgi:hypothetical protein
MHAGTPLKAKNKWRAVVKAKNKRRATNYTSTQHSTNAAKKNKNNRQNAVLNAVLSTENLAVIATATTKAATTGRTATRLGS